MSTSYRIQTEEDVAAWRRSPGYVGFVSWITKRSQRIIGKRILEGSHSRYERISKLMNVLDVMEKWVEEVPLLPNSQRFGNRAFKTYVDIVESRLPSLLPTPPAITSRILPLLISSHAFGHPVRLDYGSGHELSFVLSLWIMVQMGWVGCLRSEHGGEEGAIDRGAEEDPSQVGGEEEEDELILRVLPRYLSLVTLLQKKYRLEPAGSHGVWGLDDYCFLPYVFGSAQMLGMEETPNRSLDNAKAAMTKGEDPSDFWTLSLKRVYEFKTGPFFEHSPLLHSLSTTMPSFVKIHRGLLKMYEEEVLGKRVVVQHLSLDEITWGGGEVPSSSTRQGTVDVKEDVGVPTADVIETRAPWTMPPKRSDMDSGVGQATRGMAEMNVDTESPEALPWPVTKPGTGTSAYERTKAPWAR